MMIRRAIFSRRRPPPSPSAPHLRRRVGMQLIFQTRRCSVATGGCGCGGGSDNGRSRRLSTKTSASDEFASTNYLAWGAVASVSFIGLNRNINSNSYDGRLRCERSSRGYHSSTASCEPSSNSNPSNNGNRRSDGSNETSDSFFDLAQQWANDYALSKSRGERVDENSSSIKEGDSKEASKPQESTNDDMQTPEELLEAMGILGGSTRSYADSKTKEREDVRSGKDNSNQSDNDDHDDNKSNSNLKGMMQKVLFKFDEFQSSLPKPSPKEEAINTDTNSKQNQSTSDESSTENSSSVFSEFLSFADNATSFMRKSTQPADIEELIRQAQSIANHVNNDATNPSSSQSNNSSRSASSGFLSQVLYFQQNAQAIQQAFEASFGPHLSNINTARLFQSLPVAAMHYYLEHEDSMKTPSWKRRKHRFQKDVEVPMVEELNEALLLSELSYADNVDEIRTGLRQLHTTNQQHANKKNKPQWELLFCDTESKPGEPSHFLAIQKNASPYDDALHVLLVVRGTKSMSDLITDAMMEAIDYEYALPGISSNDNNGDGDGDGSGVIKGKAHGGMVHSGKYLVERHRKLLQTLLKLSKKRKLEITLIGHSLGAGAATIAAMEWNSKPFQSENKDDDTQVSAHVIGFGCPALLSQPLSLATKDCVTSVIADADFIPRMSGSTLVNLLLDVTNFDYRRMAERDVEQALRELQSRFSGSSDALPPGAARSKQSKLAFNIDEDDIRTVMGYVQRGLEKVSVTTISPSETEKKQLKDLGSNTEALGGQKDCNVGEEAMEKMEPVLFPPGNCIHFYRDGSGISGTYVPCNFFTEIDVARTMIEDHLISSGYRKIFLNLMRDFHKDDHFSFESKDGLGK